MFQCNMPLINIGQYQHGMPAQLSKDFPRVDHSNGIHCSCIFDAKLIIGATSRDNGSKLLPTL